ncbi:MAG: hypothetical protein H0X31_23800 [Nostocaceae cyanobacterium]|nr:hypothetical protein [Nostocaceae cyanobacterium]
MKSGDLRLRGCIGTFKPGNLKEGLTTYTIARYNSTRYNKKCF